MAAADVDQFLAEIRTFGFAFAPAGWAQCNGQLLPISQNTALFSLLGTYYGGNGQSNFALPDLRDCVPLGWGTGISDYWLGQTAGEDSVTLLETEMPVHTHVLESRNVAADLQAPSASRSLARSVGDTVYTATTGTNLVQMAPQALSVSGSSAPHNNIAPSLVLNFCIALQGIFPPRP